MSSQPEEARYPDASAAATSAEERRALDELFTKLYDKIRHLASRVRWNATNPTLNPTALAHEAYLKLRNDPPDFTAKSYNEVIAIFANAMHQILIDAARRKGAQKRIAGGLPEKADLPIEDAITIAEALKALERENPAQARIAQCRFLLGMSVNETAAALGLSKRTVERQWQEAKAQLGVRIDPAKEYIA